MKTIFLYLFIFILYLSATGCFATSQIPDYLIYKNDTIALSANPLESYPYIDSLRPTLFGNRKTGCSTACWRGYVATWKLENQKLYLIEIKSCDSYRDYLKADLKSLFEKKYQRGKVFAGWVTDSLLSRQGKLIHYVHDGYESIYEKEVLFCFNKGYLTGTLAIDNSKSRESIYVANPDSLRHFIYSHINWDKLPVTDDPSARVHVQFSGNENGIIDSVKITRHYNDIFDKEAVRVIKSIPNWSVLYVHGKFQRYTWFMPIVFTQEFRRLYKIK